MGNPTSKTPFLFVVFILFFFAAGLDWLTGYEVSSIVFYALPVGFVAWYGRLRWAVVMVVFSSISWGIIDHTTGHVYSHSWIPLFNSFTRLLVWLFEAYSISHMRWTIKRATRKIEAFSGTLPICTQCHRVCDRDGAWMAIEAFLVEYADAKPSKKVCPDCSQQIFAGQRH